MFSARVGVLVLGVAGLGLACDRADQRSSVASEPPRQQTQVAENLRAEATAALAAERGIQVAGGTPQRVALSDLGLQVSSFGSPSGVCETIEPGDILRPGESGVRFVVGTRASPERIIRAIWSGTGALVMYQDVSPAADYSVLVSDGKAVIQHNGKVATASAGDVLNAPDLGAPAQTASEVLKRCR